MYWLTVSVVTFGIRNLPEFGMWCSRTTEGVEPFVQAAFSAKIGEGVKQQKTKLESALDELLAGKTVEEITGPKGVLKQLTKALIERAMGAKLTHHLGYEEHAPEGRGSGNNRNGTSRKKVQGDFGAVEIEVPRDRNGTFEPRIIAKHERRFAGFDSKILSMYARGMSTRHYSIDT
jgi:hypothetical protein